MVFLDTGDAGEPGDAAEPVDAGEPVDAVESVNADVRTRSSSLTGDAPRGAVSR
jgi:hypothetical protein